MVVKLVNVHTCLAILNLLIWKQIIRQHPDTNGFEKNNSVMEIIQIGEKQLSRFLQLKVASHDSIFAHLTAAPPSASRPGQGILWVTWESVIHL